MFFLHKLEIMIEIREAKLEDVSQIAQLYQEVWGDKYPFPDYIKESEIEKTIRENECIWMLALDGGKVVGSATCAYNKWNNSAEFGRGVIKKEYRSQHIGKVASEKLIEKAFERGLDICYGRPRNIKVHSVVTFLGFQLVGYMPGPYLIDFRELCLFAIKLSENCRKKRVTPIEKNKIYDLHLVKEIDRALSLKENPGEYPADIFVGDDTHSTGALRFIYSENNRALFFTSLNNISEVNRGNIEYIEGDIVADKIGKINMLKSLGFKMTAYLPAWYEKEGRRFDCVKMVNYIKEFGYCDEFIQKIKELVDIGFKDD